MSEPIKFLVEIEPCRDLDWLLLRGEMESFIGGFVRFHSGQPARVIVTQLEENHVVVDVDSMIRLQDKLDKAQLALRASLQG